MNRRDFLKRMGALGLVAAAPKIIFDMGAHNRQYSVSELQTTLHFKRIFNELTCSMYHIEPVNGVYILNAHPRAVQLITIGQ